MSTIIPAILETTKADFSEKLNLVTKLPSVERIQVDFGDGEFVPNRMLSISDIDLLNPAFTWEAHLMVKEPKDFFDYLSPRDLVKQFCLLEFKLPRRCGSTTIAANLAKKYKGILFTANSKHASLIKIEHNIEPVQSYHVCNYQSLSGFKVPPDSKLFIFDCYNAYCDNSYVQEFMERYVKQCKFIAFR